MVENTVEQGREIAVVSDIHVAKSWDQIEWVVGDRVKFLNPNNELRRFVDEINTSPEIGAVVVNGDAVDYFYSDRLEERIGRRRETNWDLFYEIIGGLNKDKDILQIPGNHDYRAEPYNYHIYGLKHVNVPGKLRMKIRRQIGHHVFTGPLELPSIAVIESLFDPLQEYLGFGCPDELDVLGRHSLFLNTGSDAYARPRSLPKYLWKSLMSLGFCNDCEGLRKEDIQGLEKAVNGNAETHVFMHAPLINPKTSNPGKKYQLSVDDFLRNIVSQGIADRVMLNRGGQFLDRLRKSDGNSVVVASHTHDPRYFLIDKGNLVATEVDNSGLNERRSDPRYIKHLTTPALGALYSGRKIGYMTIGNDGYKEVIVDEY